MTPEEVRLFKSGNGKISPTSRKYPFGAYNYRPGRSNITLLDRAVAARLHKALFDCPGYHLSILTDSSKNLDAKLPENGISPFDYDASCLEHIPFVWAEDFVITCIWNGQYSSSVLSTSSRPPMAAVVMDMIDMIEFFKSQCTIDSPRATIDEWLKNFYHSQKLRSIDISQTVDENWAARGFLADLFCTVACLPRLGPPYGLDEYQRGRKELPFEENLFPGSDLLFFPAQPPVSKAASDPSVSIEDLDASFIESGPFQFRTTNRFNDHLTLDYDNGILIYKPRKERVLDFYGYPHDLGLFHNHALKGFESR